MDESPTRQLADDHEYVMLVVGAMNAEVAYIERTGRVHADRVAQMIDFTRNFTDGDHHAKEEDLLFPFLEERSAAAAGTISVLLSEHEAARDCIRAIAAVLPVAALPDAGGAHADAADAERIAAARTTVAENLRLYAFLLPLHIGKEDTVLFPLMEDVLSIQEQEMLGEDLARVGREPGSREAAERYRRLAHTLAEPPAD
jgi:hemerythrin-like domain-containing protein